MRIRRTDSHSFRFSHEYVCLDPFIRCLYDNGLGDVSFFGKKKI